MNFWLIQRGKLKTNKPSEITGLDSLVSYDYMGSAEFELGALFRALGELFQIVDQLAITETGIKRESDNKGLFIISLPGVVNDAKSFIDSQIKDSYKIRLKERSELKDAIVGDDTFGKRQFSETNFWWDIDNNWIAVIGKENARLVIDAIQKSKAKRASKASQVDQLLEKIS